MNASLYPRLPVETPLRMLSFTMALVSQEGHSDGSANVIISSLQRREHRIWAGPGDSKPTLGYQICRSGKCTDGAGDIDDIDFAAEKGREVKVTAEVVGGDRMRFSMDGYPTVETDSDPEPLSTFLFYVWSDAGRSYHVTIDDVRIGY